TGRFLLRTDTPPRRALERGNRDGSGRAARPMVRIGTIQPAVSPDTELLGDSVHSGAAHEHVLATLTSPRSAGSPPTWRGPRAGGLFRSAALLRGVLDRLLGARALAGRHGARFGRACA